MSWDTTKTRQAMWQVSFDGTDLGAIDDVDLSEVQPVMTPHVVAGIVVGYVFGPYKEGAAIKIKMAETANTTVMDKIELASGTPKAPPALFAALASLGKEVVLHISDIAAGTTTEDVGFYACIPHPKFVNRNGKQELREVELVPVPVAAKLFTSVNPYYWFGTKPA